MSRLFKALAVTGGLAPCLAGIAHAQAWTNARSDPKIPYISVLATGGIQSDVSYLKLDAVTAKIPAEPDVEKRKATER